MPRFLIMKNIYTKWFLLVSVFLMVSSIPTRANDKTDDFVKTEMQRQHIPGVSLAVIKNGKIIKIKGYGLANVETNVPVTTETVFKIGSISKPIIAMGVMLLVEDGKISLDDRVSKYLEGTPESWKDITIRNLLSHTSGIIREAPGFDPAKIQADIDVIKTAYSLPLNFAPGEKYEYCNVGYFSLAEIIRQVSGKSWGEFLTERIFKRLGMNSTRTTTFEDIVPHRANAYSFHNNKLTNAEVYSAIRPSGAFLSTVLDLAKLEVALNGASFLEPESRKSMWTPFRLSGGKESIYGLGWRIDEVSGRKRIGHGGTLNGFKSHFARFVNDGVTVIVLTNLDQVDSSEFSSKIAGLYIPTPGVKISE
jgi:D-alanyl-D-alanine carboxypeptidase